MCHVDNGPLSFCCRNTYLRAGRKFQGESREPAKMSPRRRACFYSDDTSSYTQLLLRTHRPSQDRQIININLGVGLNYHKQHLSTGPPPCSVCYVQALPSESTCQSLLAPHHPRRDHFPQCPPANSTPAKTYSPAAKTGPLIKASPWSSLVRDSIASGSNATEAALMRIGATLHPNNGSASGARAVC